MADQVSHIFVYGTLRPDDDTGAPWKSGFLEGTVQKKAILPNAALFFDLYPSVVLQSFAVDIVWKAGRVSEAGTASKRYRKIPSSVIQGASVVGYVVSCHRKEDFAAKLLLGDEIEDCPSFYQRDVVEVRLVDEDRTVKAFVYHREACKRDTRIGSGDWLDRGDVSLNPDLYSNNLPSL